MPIVLSKEMYAIKRYLLSNYGIVVPFSRKGDSPVFGFSNDTLHRALRNLLLKEYVTKIGNWQHAWYFVTEEGHRKLNEEVGLPEEFQREEKLKIIN